MKQIVLTQGKVANVSDHRFEHFNQWSWYALRVKNNKWYAVRKEGKFPFRKLILMHRQIMGVADPKIQVDHRDNDGLNNTDENLRKCTNAQNGRNRKLNKNSTTGFKGVSSYKKKFVANIRFNNEPFYLGTFTDPIAAARAYDAKAIELHGEFANLNFPQVTS